MSEVDSASAFFRPAALRSARLAAGVTLDELAQAAGRTAWAVAAIEAGTLAPSIVTAYAFAKFLDVDVVSLYGGNPLADEDLHTPGFTAASAGHLASLAGATA